MKKHTTTEKETYKQNVDNQKQLTHTQKHTEKQKTHKPST